MKKSKIETAETRKNIIKSAAKQFRAKGIAATGLAEIMESVGLTNGGFYRHFESKDQLIRESIQLAADNLLDYLNVVMKESDKGNEIESVVEIYLSCVHKEHPESGCALAGIGSELSRADALSREIATNNILQFIDILLRQSGDEVSEEERKRATATVSMLVGALTLSRIVSDADLSNQILGSAKEAAIELLKLNFIPQKGPVANFE